MSKVLVTINDGNKERLVILPNTSTDDVLQSLVDSPSDESATVFNFLERTGSLVSFETPQSSNVVRVTFNAVTSEIGFVFEGESQSTYPATFADFVNAMNAPSIGKLQWKYRKAYSGK